ncbi:MAG: alkaline phosphatase D family protein [Opitutales bacterium]
MPSFRCFLGALISLLSPTLVSSLPAALASGPMLGPVEMREARIWIQAEEPSLVRVRYSVNESGEEHFTAPVQTHAALANTATLHLTELQPGQAYTYQVEIDGELLPEEHRFSVPAFYQDRSPPPDFTIAVGGAHYVPQEGFEPPYQTLGGGNAIFESIREINPQLMLWLGNTAHLRVSDWASQSGYLKRYQHARSPGELAPLLATVPHYATWGEADYGSPGAGAASSYRQVAETAFRAFWPQPVEVPSGAGLVTRFRYADVDFFLLDTRSQRNDRPISSEPAQILGEAQIEWLRQELIRSDASFKVIAAGAPILNPADSRSNLRHAKEEHTALLQTLRSEAIPGLFFISGGKYYGELTRLVHSSSYNLYDLTVGPLTAKPRENQDELNYFRMPGTSTFERHFARLDVSGPEEARELTLRILDTRGELIWTRTIPAAELQPESAE